MARSIRDASGHRLLAKRNADNYAYAALEIYWTVACNQQPAGQNGRFWDPIP